MAFILERGLRQQPNMLTTEPWKIPLYPNNINYESCPDNGPQLSTYDMIIAGQQPKDYFLDDAVYFVDSIHKVTIRCKLLLLFFHIFCAAPTFMHNL